MAKCKFCGGVGVMAKPLKQIRFDAEKGKQVSYYIYCFKCDKCGVHTLHGSTPAEASKLWEEQKFSQETELLMKPLTTETVNIDSAVAIYEEVARGMANQYIDLYAEYLRGNHSSDITSRLQGLERKLRVMPFMDVVEVDFERVLKSYRAKARKMVDGYQKGRNDE